MICFSAIHDTLSEIKRHQTNVDKMMGIIEKDQRYDKNMSTIFQNG